MSAKFYTLLTEIGAAKLASAAALGVPLKITKMAVGDGGGVLPTPDAKQTALVNEKRRADLNMLYIDPQNSSQIIAEQVIPETEGGWWIREVGLFDDTGALIAVGNCPESYKPQLAEGSGRTQTVRMVLITSSTDNITLKIDPAVVLATRKYVDDKVLELKVYVDDLMAKHLAAADPHTQYAPKESPTLTGTPKAPTAPAGNNTTQIATTAFVQAIAAAINSALALKAPLASPGLTGTPTAPTAAQTANNTQIATTAFVKAALAGLVGSSPAALDTLNELAAALGNDPNFATTMTNALAGKQPLDSTLTTLSGKTADGIIEYLHLVDASGYAGRMVKISSFTTSGVFTKTEGARFALVRAVGGGGGGGGTAGVSNQQAVGAAGESGGYIEAWIDLASVTSLPVTIGSAGAGGAAGANFGSSGGTTSLGTLVICPGGNGGPGGSPSGSVTSLNSDYGSESTVAPSTTGKLIASIRSKRDSYRMALSLTAVIGGCGGSSPFGRGGAPGLADSGKDGQGYGSGGGGASSTGTSFKGGNGAPGIMIIQEYF
ncbi:phage tail protein [Enterobacter hormaechei]|uniref:phage tail protein n=1 Tax=Enterobacter hormaechei TaxID=158836 RepID=UPI00403AC031